jgi:hypothetical protein
MGYKIRLPRRASTLTQIPSLGGYVIQRHGRFWAVLDATETLICLTVYKRGAIEVMRRLESKGSSV